MDFSLHILQPNQQYIQIVATLNTLKDETTIFFPAWRPGRYELGDFAKNVNHFEIFNEKGNKVDFHKTNKNTWKVNTSDCKKITVKYQYYAAELNAGSTYLDHQQLYVNPVNCFLFTDEEKNQPITVQLNIPNEWEVAHSLKVENKQFVAKNYDQLADSPFICSAMLQHDAYVVEGVRFNIWFNGIVHPDWKRVLNDFKAFTKVQIEKYGKFPVDEYHFLFQILPYKAYHGVEHCRSTVISFGPSFAVFEELYTEFLGVSSHELYHSWNIKSIRPIEMMPYNFKQENYSELGYIAEGVTTYMGDLMLLRSQVFDKKQYLKEMSAQIQKHADNFGRLNYSVAESSFDTWLDGYVPGAPGRKVSIYTEGCLLAFIADVIIMKNTQNKFGIDEVMRRLYSDFACQGKGVSDADYRKVMEDVAGISMQWYFEDYVHGTHNYFPKLEEAFDYLGLKIDNEKHPDYFAQLGAKLVVQNGNTVIVALDPDGVMSAAGAVVGDELLSINGVIVNEDASRWAQFFKDEPLEIVLSRKGTMLSLLISKERKGESYQIYKINEINNPSKEQQDAYAFWALAKQ